jgi:hypothetical protein
MPLAALNTQTHLVTVYVKFQQCGPARLVQLLRLSRVYTAAAVWYPAYYTRVLVTR